MMKKRFVVITGPTASGKTQVSISVAKAIKAEIISADSMQIYRGMDIGTAKAAADEMQGVPHHMIDIVSPGEEYSVAQFQKQAFFLIDEMNDRGVLPIVSGGTGLYINALVYRLDFAQSQKCAPVRQKYSQLADDKSLAYLYNKLKEKDPEYAGIISCNDKRRIIRRLEIIETTGKKDYCFRQYNQDYEILMIGLEMQRDALYQRINARVDDMFRNGLMEEVHRLYTQFGDVNALKAIGYKELISHFNGEYGLDEAVGLVKRNTRRYAKRQITWFKRDKRIEWFDISPNLCIKEPINGIIKHIKRKGF